LVSASVRLADPDRSVKGNGLAVHGSITKEPVATGADVVAYSGFSNSNYLEQPYNSDLDFGAYTGTAGTGDFCVMGWVKSNDNWGAIIDRGDGSTPYGNSLFVGNGVTTGLQIRVGGADVTGYIPVWNSVWHHFVTIRKDGVVSIYIDGEHDRSYGTVSNDVSVNGAVTRIGVRVSGSAELDQDSSLALLRISATAPTADQIAKIYEDEKFLFQEDAKATLTGSSDAVTALAHDPDTNLLHVGTSGGRSVFQGLRRVDETATAVTTAISAVDGLVVEQ
jgi:hypothetical protein